MMRIESFHGDNAALYEFVAEFSCCRRRDVLFSFHMSRRQFTEFIIISVCVSAAFRIKLFPVRIDVQFSFSKMRWYTNFEVQFSW